MNLPPQVLQALMQSMLQGKGQTGAVGAGGNAPTSASVNGGGGVGGGSIAGSNTAGLNQIVGAAPSGNVAGLGSEGGLQAGQASTMNPQMVGTLFNGATGSTGSGGTTAAGAGADASSLLRAGVNGDHAMSALTDLTAGVGDQPGTVGYGQAAQNRTDNPAGAIGTTDQTGFDVSGGTGSQGATIPTGPNVSGSASFGRDLNNLIQPGNKGSMGYTIPKRLTNNLLRMDGIFPQTGLQPYRGPIG